MRIDGSCHCGDIAFEAEVDPSAVGICHCRDCQTLTGSAYRVAVPAPTATFRILRGTPTIYVKTADSGRRRAHAFCPRCGTPIYATAPENPQAYSIRVGTTRQSAELRPQRQIWCRSALPWAMNIEALPKTAAQPA